MKKILFLITVCLAIFCLPGLHSECKAQAPMLLTTTSYGNTLDTVTGSTTISTTAKVIPVWKTGGGITAQVIVTKISGTVAGTLGLYGSMDGTKFTLIGSATTPSDTSANYGFNTTVRWYYYRLSWAGTGTMSASAKFYLAQY